MKSFLASIALVSALFAGTATAADYNFGSVSVNHLDWSSKTEDNSHHSDYNFIELELGGGREWGSFYGFTDIERFNDYKELADVKVSIKGTVSVNTDMKNISQYYQVFSYVEKDLQLVDAVAGAQYSLAGEAWVFNPFVGLHYSVYNNNFAHKNYAGVNGIMVGWNAMYNFDVMDQKFSITNWNEFTVLRSEQYQRNTGEVKDFGVNGAVALWYHPIPQVSTGVQYRYANNKLGTEISSNAVIYTVKYNF